MSALPDKPAVLFVTRKWRPAVGGMEEYSHALTEALQPLTKLTVRSLPGRPNGQPPRVLALFAFGLATVAHLLLHPGRYDVVHVGDLALWPLALFAGWCNRRARLIASAHGTDIALPLRHGIGPRLYGLYLRAGACWCPRLRIVANSHATARHCEDAGFAVGAVVPLGVELPPAAPPIELPSPYVLFVGRLVRRKGCRWFVENVLPLIDDRLRLVVAGTEWDAAESAVLANPRVEFLGPVRGEALARLRREALVVVMPNVRCDGRDFEGFGLTAIEAAADQGVLLASELDGIVDAVVDGVSGFLLPPESAEAWAARIREVERWTVSERRKFVAAARECVGRQFSWARVANETLDAYAAAAVQQPSRIDRCIAFARRMHEGGRASRLRTPILILAVVAFAAGLVVSIRALPETLGLVAPRYLWLSALLAVPAAIVLNGIETRLNAALAGTGFGWLQAMRVGLVSSAANMLPLPGGALVRIAALRGAGASLLRSGATTTLIAIAWVGLACSIAGIWIAGAHPAVGLPLLTLGAVTTLALSLALHRVCRSWRLVLAVLATRTAGIAVSLVRMAWALAALGVMISAGDVSVFAVADVAGSAVSIVPAGLGVSEAVAALMAPLVQVPAAAAFLAASLNRIVALPVLVLATGLVGLVQRWRSAP